LWRHHKEKVRARERIERKARKWHDDGELGRLTKTRGDGPNDRARVIYSGGFEPTSARG
jgi:hypothetical protein